MGSDYLMGRASFWGMRRLGTGQRCWLQSVTNVLNATELYV